MENQKTQSTKGKLIRRTLAVIAVIVILLTTLRITLKSDWLLDRVRTMVENQVSQNLNGFLTIEQLKGDLLSGLTVINTTVSDEAGTALVSLDSLHVGYSVFSLLKSPIIIDGIVLSGLNIKAVKTDTDEWNLMNLIPEEEPDKTDPDPLYWYVDFLRIKDSGAEIESNELPDGRLEIRDLELVSSLGMFEDGWLTVIDELSLNVIQERLPQPVEFLLRGEGDEKRINLEQLVIAAGRSFLSASGRYTDQSEIHAEAITRPLSWRELALFTEDLPLKDDLNIELTIQGRLPVLSVQVNVTAEHLQRLYLTGDFQLDDKAKLTRLEVELEKLNGPLFTGSSEAPEIESLSYSGEGSIYFDDSGDDDWQSLLTTKNIRLEQIILDQLLASLQLKGNQLYLKADIEQNSGQKIAAVLAVNNYTSQTREWNTEITSEHFNPSLWLPEFEAEADLNFHIVAGGTGFEPAERPFNLDLRIYDSSIYDQQFSEITLTGQITQNLVTGTLAGRIDRSSFLSDIEISNWQNEPEYKFNSYFSEFNLAEFNGLEEFPTYINAEAEGKGKEFDIESMLLEATVWLDSSIINGEPVEKLIAAIFLNNGILKVEDTELKSPIADGTFRIRQNLFNLQDLQNDLDFELNIKNPQPLAPLFEIEKLTGSGMAAGRMEVSENGVSELVTSLDLVEFQFDSLLNAESINGSAHIKFYENPSVFIHFEMGKPVVNNLTIQDFNLITNFQITDHYTSGDIEFNLINDTESSLHQAGEFRFENGNLRVTNELLTFITPERTLSLQNPFVVNWIDETLSTNTLFLQTDDGDSYVKLLIAGIDTLNQQFDLEASRLNIGVLQRTLTDHSVADGYFSGNLSVHNTPDFLNLQTSAKIENFEMYHGKMDSVKVEASVEDEWFDGSIEAWNDQISLLQGAIRIPFLPGDPLTFDEQFFERNIDGRFQVNSARISYWLSFLEDTAFEDTDGIFSFKGLVAGTAGMPEFTGSVLTTEATASGIRIDTLNVEMIYKHEEDAIDLEGSIISLAQKVLDFEVRLPLSADFKQFEFLFPQEGDSVKASLRTNQFNLAVLSDFLPQEAASRLRGRLDGDVNLFGVIGELETSGSLTLSNGNVRITPTGVNLENINSRITLNSDRVSLERFSMRSGPGQLNANGFVELDNLKPGNINVTVRANQFRVANTQQMRAIIDLQAQLEGSLIQPVLTGSLRFLNGHYELQNFGERAIEDVQLEGEDGPLEFAFFDSLAMEMEVIFNRQFFIRNRQFLDLEIELSGRLDLLKNRDEEMQMFGTIEGVSGFARPLGKNFVIDDATVAFAGPIDNPE
ncbi:MAG: translocation/assembly module TamB domain-containing protein, partial [Balneolaceae bacterium]